MYKVVSARYDERAVRNNDGAMDKSSFGLILETKGVDRTVIKEKRLKFTDYPSGKKDM